MHFFIVLQRGLVNPVFDGLDVTAFVHNWPNFFLIYFASCLIFLNFLMLVMSIEKDQAKLQKGNKNEIIPYKKYFMH